MLKPMDFNDLELMKIGNELEITGVVYGDHIIMLPDEEVSVTGFGVMHCSLEQWKKIVRQSDLKETMLVGDSKDKKIILRKSTRQIEQRLMWSVFRRDNYQCRYCGATDQPLTVDHMVLWEAMGPSIETNLITSCKKCNNRRGSMLYEDWLLSPYYLSKVPQLTVTVIAENARVAMHIPDIKRNWLREVKRSR